MLISVPLAMSIDLLVAADIIQKNGNTEMNETITRKMYEGISLFCIDDPCFFLVTLVTYFQIDKCQYSNHDEYDNRHC